ncbi:MAG: DUF3276 family protein [Chloroflexi bacterium]|nr:DUF3276 family protein [Chloroflexota bacterium]
MATDRRELFSERVPAGSRSYAFDVKESREGKKYLVITEWREVGGRGSHRHTVMVFEEHVPVFRTGLEKAVAFLGKKYDVASLRGKYAHAYEKWSDEEDARLRTEYRQGKTIDDLAASFQRQPTAVRSRLQKLALL